MAGARTINYVADGWRSARRSDGQIDQHVVETSIDPKLQSVAEAAVIDDSRKKASSSMSPRVRWWR